MPQFIVTREDLDPAVPSAVIRDNEARHCAAVLRCGVGDEVHLTDGLGSRWKGVCTSVSNTRIRVAQLQPLPANEPATAVDLLQGLPKGECWDTVLEKGTELGVRSFRPVYTERSVPHIVAQRLERRLQRWREKVRAALKQCERGRLPRVEKPLPLPESLLQLGPVGASELRLYLAERTAPTPWPRGEGIDTVRLAVGPEGGWAPDELLTLGSAGFHPVSLGPRILRADTAAVVGVALALERWGDLVSPSDGW